MAILSVSIPDDLKSKMNSLDEINWSAVARKAFENKVEEALFLKKMANKSKLTKKDAEELGKKINASMSRKFMEL